MPVLLLRPAGKSISKSISSSLRTRLFLRLSGSSDGEILGRGWRSIAGEQADHEALDAVDASLNASEGHDAGSSFAAGTALPSGARSRSALFSMRLDAFACSP